ncbi:MAG TPA: tRNA pseudouridine(13) synthase TruD, partial [archaeon]|nr:tRNA pseudouridine(13) synthase TruD [archaeon]
MFPGAIRYLTPDLPAVPCTVRKFEVFEVPKFLPTGSGSHHWVLVEKYGLTTHQLLQLLATDLNADPRDLGCAGLKDKHARTFQWISYPSPASAG